MVVVKLNIVVRPSVCPSIPYITTSMSLYDEWRCIGRQSSRMRAQQKRHQSPKAITIPSFISVRFRGKCNILSGPFRLQIQIGICCFFFLDCRFVEKIYRENLAGEEIHSFFYLSMNRVSHWNSIVFLVVSIFCEIRALIQWKWQNFPGKAGTHFGDWLSTGKWFVRFDDRFSKGISRPRANHHNRRFSNGKIHGKFVAISCRSTWIIDFQIAMVVVTVFAVGYFGREIPFASKKKIDFLLDEWNSDLKIGG